MSARRDLIQRFNNLYPKVIGGFLNGWRVLKEIPNLSSIDSSLMGDRVILPGIRAFPLEGFSGVSYFYSADDVRHCWQLIKLLKVNKKIKPVIVVEETEGPYILEGIHRVSSFVEMKETHVPALIVIDLYDFNVEDFLV